MEAEAQPFIDHLQLENKTSDVFPSNVPFHAFMGTYNETHNVTVITSGKDAVYGTGVDNCGTVPAALCVYLALQQLRRTNQADLLINAGTCGGFRRKGADIGDVFLTTAVAHHDRRIPIPPFVPYGIGRLESKLTKLPTLADAHQYKMGICSTGNSLDKTEEDDQHMLSNDASVKDMEAAAIAWACELHQVPFLGVKVVTDIVDGERATAEEFLEHLHTASRSLQDALPKVLEYICGKEHHEL